MIIGVWIQPVADIERFSQGAQQSHNQQKKAREKNYAADAYKKNTSLLVFVPANLKPFSPLEALINIASVEVHAK